jgi:copper transport protein
MARRVQRTHEDVAELDLGSIDERLVRERRARGLVHSYGHAVLQREASVPGDVIGVRVRLEHADETDIAARALIQIRLDRVSRIDDDGDAGLLVADEIGGAAEVVVDELPEEHDPTLPINAAISPEVKRLVLPIAVAVALAAPAASWAHANLVRTVPANGAVLARGPAEARIVFDDVVQVGPGVEAIRNGGASILAGRPRVEQARTLVVPLRRGLADGNYSVRWSIVSDDGHLESGVVAFAVGVGRPRPVAALAPESTGPTAGTAAARWLFLAGLLAAVGIALFTLVVRPADESGIPLVLSSAGVLAAIGAAVEVHRVGLATRDGTALGAGAVAAVVVAALGAAALRERRALVPALWLALGLAAVPALAGHALDPGLTRVNVVADVFHVTAASAWVGVLLGLLLLRGVDARRAGALALAAVLVLGMTGIVRASFELTAASQLWENSYGRALLVKTGLLLGVLGAGWLARGRVRGRAAIELVLVAGLVLAVAVLVQLRPGRNILVTARAPVQVAEPSPPPPPTPQDAVVLAREAGPLGVVVAVEPRRTRAIVLSPAGGGLSGLDVRVDEHPTSRCGSGCYAADVAHGRTVTVDVSGYGVPRRATFALPAHAPPADALVRRMHTVYKALRSVVYRERLASDPGHAIVALWRLEKPARVEYAVAGGADGIVIGGRRWDRDARSKPWKESPQTPLPQPATQWAYAVSAHEIARTRRTITVSFADPAIPAYFTVMVDRRTLLPHVLHMVAPAHFMTDRYLSFNAPRAIRPPR